MKKLHNYFNDYSEEVLDELREASSELCQALGISFEILMAYDKKLISKGSNFSGDKDNWNILFQLRGDVCLAVTPLYGNDLFKYVVKIGSRWSASYPHIKNVEDFFSNPSEPTDAEWTLYIMEVGDEWDFVRPSNLKKLLVDNYKAKVFGDCHE